MITWMQRHKKYLVVTIWIATIAFIGAGFVGWGAYDFNSDRASAVAKVGERKITVQEYQMAYANYYNFYNNMLGGELTQEKADQMGLEKMVIQSIINETLLLSYADEIGLRVQDAEIKETLANDDAFKVDGIFNKEAYYRVVKQSGVKAKDYENSLKKQILLTKIQNALKLKPTKIEQEMLASSMFMKDKLAIDIIYLSADEGIVKEDEIKKYWEENKQNYLTEKSYDLETIKVALTTESIDEEELKEYFNEKKHNYKDSEGKLLSLETAYADVEKDFRLKNTKRDALETYLLFKKGQMNATGTLNIKISDTTFPVNSLKNARVGTVLKPIEQEDGYIVIKIANINEPTPKPYIDAKGTILVELKQLKQTETLRKKAEARLEVFNGRNIGFVSRDTTKTIGGLTQEESLEFINFVFDNNKERNFKILGNKAVLYKILEQNLLANDKLDKYVDLLNENIAQLKQAEIGQNLIAKLKTRYETEQYYKGN